MKTAREIARQIALKTRHSMTNSDMIDLLMEFAEAIREGDKKPKKAAKKKAAAAAD